jgi:small-conductance mechanosensitive channel
MIIVVIYLTIGIQKIAMYLINTIWHKKKDEIDIGEDFNSFLNTAIGAILWTLAIVLVLQNLGYNITALVGGLGVIGIAIAFALQNVLSDLFAYFIIMLDKPFKKGDFIIVGEDMGTVKKIGKKTTRISTLEGQELIISNKELSEARINNYGRMNTRRVVFKIGVTYETPRQKLAKVTDIIKSIIETQDKAKIDRSNLYNFGDYSLDFETVYYIATPDYNTFMDIQEKINFSIIQAFEEEGIQFAYPTQTILVEKN